MADQLNQGKILSIRSSVVDVQFSVAPQIRNVLTAGEKGEYISKSLRNWIAIHSGCCTDSNAGIDRGATVTDTGKAFEVRSPRADGRVFNVFGIH